MTSTPPVSTSPVSTPPASTPPVSTQPVIAERVIVRVLKAAVDHPIPMSFSSLLERQMCLVEVHAGGLVGIGESWLNYPPWAAHERVATLLEGVAPLVLGTDVSQPGIVQDLLVSELSAVGRQWGAPGPIWQAISAIDLALWDLLGKRTHTSVSELLGGHADVAPAYASGVGPTQVEQLCELAVERGITAIKAKVGFDEATDRATLASIRRVAPQLQIFADANCAWSLDQAINQARILADEGVVWLEEPLRDHSPATMAELSERTGMTLAAGENAYGVDELVTLAAIPGLGQVQPDPAKSGGITTCQLLAARLPSHVSLTPHWYAGAVGLRASIAVAAGLPGGGWVELDLRSNPLRDDLVSGGFPLDEHGRLLADDRPGLIADLDDEWVNRLQVSVDERRIR